MNNKIVIIVLESYRHMLLINEYLITGINKIIKLIPLLGGVSSIKLAASPGPLLVKATTLN